MLQNQKRFFEKIGGALFEMQCHDIVEILHGEIVRCSVRILHLKKGFTNFFQTILFGFVP
jgi:hypothetical protein